MVETINNRWVKINDSQENRRSDQLNEINDNIPLNKSGDLDYYLSR